MDEAVEREFEDFVRANYSKLLRLGYLLCGDSHHAEDLVQTALAKAALSWRRLRWEDGIGGYVQRTLINSFINAQRRRSWWERPWDRTPEVVAEDGYACVDERDVLRRALSGLPARQRAAVILRFYQDFSEEQVAAVMGCSVGTVKSLSSRGLRRLRIDLGTATPQAVGAPTLEGPVG